MSSAFNYDRRVEFRDTDAAGILHFTSYFAYMEEAEHALLRHWGTSVMQEVEDATVGWPRVSVTCDFAGSAKFEDMLRIAVFVDRVGTTSVTYRFEFHNADKAIIATGKMTSVCCRIVHGQPPKAIPIPTALKTKFQAAGSAS